MRSNNPLLDGAQDLSSNPPVNLDVEASQPVIPPLAGKTKLTKKPPKYSEIYKENDKTGSVGSTSSSSLSNPPEYTSKVHLYFYLENYVVAISTIIYNHY